MNRYLSLTSTRLPPSDEWTSFTEVQGYKAYVQVSNGWNREVVEKPDGFYLNVWSNDMCADQKVSRQLGIDRAKEQCDRMIDEIERGSLSPR